MFVSSNSVFVFWIFEGHYRTITSPVKSHRRFVLFPNYRLWIYPITGSPVKSPVLLTSWVISNICKSLSLFQILINQRFVFINLNLVRLCNDLIRRLNNNSLSGPFPASLSQIPHLSFLWVYKVWIFFLLFNLKTHVFWCFGFRDLSYNNLRGPVPKFPARTFK